MSSGLVAPPLAASAPRGLGDGTLAAPGQDAAADATTLSPTIGGGMPAWGGGVITAGGPAQLGAGSGMRLLDDPFPQSGSISIAAIVPDAYATSIARSQEGTPGRFRITRTGDLSQPAGIMLSQVDEPNKAFMEPDSGAIGRLSGPTWWSGTGGGVTIPAGESSVEIEVIPYGGYGPSIRPFTLQISSTSSNTPVVGSGRATVNLNYNIRHEGNTTNSDNTSGSDCGCDPFTYNPDKGDATVVPNPYGRPDCGAPKPVYSSANHADPVIDVDYHPKQGTTDSGGGVTPPPPLPPILETTITINGSAVASAVYATGSSPAGKPVRMSLPVNTASLATGSYTYTATTVTKSAAGAVLSTFTTTDRVEVTKGYGSVYGGWTMQGISQLLTYTGGATLVRSDGSSVRFQESGGVYTAPAFDRTNRLARDTVNNTWILSDPQNNREVYDSQGRLIQRIDRLGNTTSYAYVDADGDGAARELSTATDPYGRIATYTYVGGKLDSYVDFAGRTTKYYYTGGLLTSIVQPDPDGAGPQTAPGTTFGYNGSGRLTTETQQGGQVRTIAYNTAGQVTSTTVTNRGTTTYVAARGAGLPGAGQGTTSNPAPVAAATAYSSTITDGLSQTTTLYMDAQGQTTKWVRGDQSVEYRYAGLGLRTWALDPDPDGPSGPLTASVTTYEYDARGNLTKAYHPGGATETWTYDATYGQVTTYKDPLGRTTTFTIDPANGNTTAITDPMGRVTSYAYDAKGKLTGITLPDPDGTGPLTASTTNYAYDSRGRLTTVTNPDSTTRLFTYSGADDLITSVDELGRVTSYAYDLMSRLVGVTYPDPDGAGPLASPTVTYKLRGDGQVEAETDPLGRVTSYGYDSAGRLVSVTRPDPDGTGPLGATTTTVVYDALNRIIRSADPLGRVTSYAYDAFDNLRVTEEPGTGSPRTTYTYDLRNRLVSVSDPLGRVTSYSYDERNRLTAMTQPDAGAGSPVWSYQYDAASQLIGQADPLGRVTNLAYNLAGQLASVTGPDPDGAGPLARPIATYTYDGRGRQSTAIDPLGRVTSYAYDARNRLTTVTYPDPDGAGPQASPWTAYQYDAVGNVTAMRERVDASRSRITTVVYDNLDRLIEAKNPVYNDQAPATVGTQYGYDAVGNLTKVTDPLGRVTSYAYDGWDRLTTLTLPNPGGGSPVVKYAYDAVSNLLSVTDPNNQVTSYAYDARDQLTTVTYPNPGSGSPVAKYEYDLAGNLTKATDPLGRVTSYAYDALDRLATVTQPDGGDGNPITKYGYDLVGNLTKVTDPLGRVTSYAYDALDRLTTLTLPSPAAGQPTPTSSYEYDAAGNLTRAIDPNSNERRWAYDNLDRLVTETLAHAAGQSATAPKVVLQYDSLGRRTALTDPMSNTTTWVYDARDLVTQEIDPRNKSTTYAYDDAGQLTQKVDRNVRRTDYAYDALGRMTTETWYSGATPIRSVVQSYDKLSRLTGVADPAATLIFAYDNLSRLTTATTSGTATGQPNVTLAYGYDAVGNRTSMADNLATVGRTTYIYDALDRLGTIARAIGTATMTVAFDYDLGNRLISAARKAGASGASITSGYAYDNLDRLTTLTHQNSTTPPGTSLASYAYGYDAGGRLTKEVDHRGTATYTYDPQGQLTGIDRPGTAQDRALTFDANGNRTMSGYSTGTGNRLNSGEGYTYTYDDEGNLTSKVQTATGEVTSYTYDHRNRLTHVERRSSTNVVLAVADYVYDGLDRRIETVIDADGANPNPAVTTWTVYDGLDAYADFNASGTLQTRYLFGPGVDNLLARTSSAGATDWYLTDRLGSVREIVGGAGAVSYTADYDAFGVREATTGAGGDRWGFTGRETDAASGLQYNRARYYDPATSRWISQDPIGFAAGDQNLYRYVGNGSINYIDPSGFFGEGPSWQADNRGWFELLFSDLYNDTRELFSPLWRDYQKEAMGADNWILKGEYERRQSGPIGSAGIVYHRIIIPVSSGIRKEGCNTYQAITHPVQTAENISVVISNPRLVYDSINNIIEHRNGLSIHDQNDFDNELVGRGVFSLFASRGVNSAAKAGTSGMSRADAFVNAMIDRGMARNFGRFSPAPLIVTESGAFAVNTGRSLVLEASPALGRLPNGGMLPGGVFTGVMFMNDASKMGGCGPKHVDPRNPKQPTFWDMSIPAEEAIKLHHAWPKYLGGAINQQLERLPKYLHDKYHSGLDKLLPRAWGKNFYDNLSAADRAAAFEKLKNFTQAFDRANGTNLWDAAIREGVETMKGLIP